VPSKSNRSPTVTISVIGFVVCRASVRRGVGTKRCAAGFFGTSALYRAPEWNPVIFESPSRVTALRFTAQVVPLPRRQHGAGDSPESVISSQSGKRAAELLNGQLSFDVSRWTAAPNHFDSRRIDRGGATAQCETSLKRTSLTRTEDGLTACSRPVAESGTSTAPARRSSAATVVPPCQTRNILVALDMIRIIGLRCTDGLQPNHAPPRIGAAWQRGLTCIWTASAAMTNEDL
jgi:hypothetical protein